mmetsp:Transcript_18802/g.48043  ORF Transcript_18802/g.48043 Transcript_18802/m.48043 type:complete len:278 (-) Transcript_18802:709-1542(-)
MVVPDLLRAREDRSRALSTNSMQFGASRNVAFAGGGQMRSPLRRPCSSAVLTTCTCQSLQSAGRAASTTSPTSPHALVPWSTALLSLASRSPPSIQQTSRPCIAYSRRWRHAASGVLRRSGGRSRMRREVVRSTSSSGRVRRCSRTTSNSSAPPCALRGCTCTATATVLVLRRRTSLNSQRASARPYSTATCRRHRRRAPLQRAMPVLLCKRLRFCRWPARRIQPTSRVPTSHALGRSLSGRSSSVACGPARCRRAPQAGSSFVSRSACLPHTFRAL